MGMDRQGPPGEARAVPVIESVSAVTLAVTNMTVAVAFYGALGFEVLFGGAEASFSSFRAGTGYLNLVLVDGPTLPNRRWWGRIIFYVSDVDALYALAIANGLTPESPPRDAEWGERYFHLIDPDGHELSFARPI